MQLIDQLKSQLSDSIVNNIAEYVGADSIITRNVINSSFSSVIGALVSTNSNENQANKVNKILESISNSEDLLSPKSDLAILEASGSDLIKQLLGGDLLSSMTHKISKEAEAEPAHTSKILGVIAPWLLKSIYNKSEGHENFYSFLNLNSGSVTSKISTNENDIDRNEGFGDLIKRLLPLLLFMLLVCFLWWFWQKSCRGGGAMNTNTETVLDTAQNNASASPILDSTAIAAKTAWEKQLGKLISIKLADGKEIDVPENGEERKLIEFLSNSCQGDLKETWFNMDRLLFKTGSAELNDISKEQISNLTSIFKAYGNATFKIGGYTDNVGNIDANKKLSYERAAAVMSSIGIQGIDSKRMQAEGYGPEYPVCPENNSEECRAMNRRVALRIMKCH